MSCPLLVPSTMTRSSMIAAKPNTTSAPIVARRGGLARDASPSIGDTREPRHAGKLAPMRPATTAPNAAVPSPKGEMNRPLGTATRALRVIRAAPATAYGRPADAPDQPARDELRDRQLPARGPDAPQDRQLPHPLGHPRREPRHDDERSGQERHHRRDDKAQVVRSHVLLEAAAHPLGGLEQRA